MKYCSTRGKVQAESFEDVLFSGFTSDGGLYMPERIPVVDECTLQNWKSLSYMELVSEVTSLFIPPEEIPPEELKDLITNAYAEFQHKDIVSLAAVNNFHVLELFHGKTLAFKDFSLACVGAFMDYFLNKRKKHVITVVSTSGDTGSAAIESVRKSKWVDIIVMYPEGRCSQIQELQMTTILDENVHVIRGEGSSDDLDVPMKKCFSDDAFAKSNNLCVVNSINWCRIMVQTVHLLYAYLRVCHNVGDIVKFVIPSGGLGHCTAAMCLYKMGVPLQVVCAVNENDIVHRTLSLGDFSPSGDVRHTWSCSMDIEIPYNMERLLLLFSDMNYGRVDSLMRDFEQNKSLIIPEDLKGEMCKVLSSASMSCDQTLKTMKECWDENKYLLCPHTAVGVKVVWDQRHANDLKTPIICVATASPAKFPEAVRAAGIEMPPYPQLAELFTSPTRYTEMKKGEDWYQILRDMIKDISRNKHHNENNGTENGSEDR